MKKYIITATIAFLASSLSMQGMFFISRIRTTKKYPSQTTAKSQYTTRPCEKLIRLPSPGELEQRLKNVGMQKDFFEKTNLERILGDEEKYPLGVAIAVEQAIHHYNKGKHPIIKKQMKMHKPLMLKELLKDHPEAIESLKHLGVLE